MTASNGATADYYKLPSGATELQHLISYRNLNAQDGEIFRAIYRKGRASHSDELRDARKVLFYAQAEVERLEALHGQRHPMTPNVWDESRIDAIGQNGNNGEHYQEVGGDSHVPAEDMTDPANWRAGDLVECVKSGRLSLYTEGDVYRVRGAHEGAITIFDNFGVSPYCLFTSPQEAGQHFRFHSRPSAQAEETQARLDEIDAALGKMVPAGWHCNPGKHPEIDGDARIDIWLRDGEIQSDHPANAIDWTLSGDDPESVLYWRFTRG